MGNGKWAMACVLWQQIEYLLERFQCIEENMYVQCITHMYVCILYMYILNTLMYADLQNMYTHIPSF